MLLVLANKAAAQHCDQQSNNELTQDEHTQLKQKVRQSIVPAYYDNKTERFIDPIYYEKNRLSADDKNIYENCIKKVNKTLKKLIKDEPQFAKKAYRLFLPPKGTPSLQIFCTNRLSLSGASLAGFYPESNDIEIYAPYISIGENKPELPIGMAGTLTAYLKHEIEHAYLTLSKGKKCPTKKSEHDMLPYYPSSDENFQKYKNALDMGERRVQEFVEFVALASKMGFMGVIEGKLLAINRIKTLTNWQKMGELVTRFMEIINASPRYECQWSGVEKDFYQQHIQDGWKEGIAHPISENVNFHGSLGVKLNLVQQDPTNYPGLYWGSFCGDLGFFSLKQGLDAESVSYFPIYIHLDEECKLAERDAYTIQDRPESLYNLFYQEVVELKKKHVSQCMDDLDPRLNAYTPICAK